MPPIYQPQYRLLINGFDVSATVAPYLIRINLEDVFDTNLSVSKLELVFHAKYKRSLKWQYKDQLKLELWWSTTPTLKLISNIFYVDYITDVSEAGGNQTFMVSALEADPTLGYNYGSRQVIYTNKTVRAALTEFRDLFGLTLTENITSSLIYMGTTRNYLTATTLDSVIAFDSYADMLKYVCKNYGYFGNVSGKALTITRVNTQYAGGVKFTPPPVERIIDLNFRQTYNALNKEYRARYVSDRTNKVISEFVLTPAMAGQLNNKTKKLETDDAYFNINTATERATGEMYQDFYAGFEMRLQALGRHDYLAGDMFLLDASYGASEGYYRCTRVNHRVDGRGWITEISGFPPNIINSTSATFEVGYLGRTNNPPQTVNITQTIAGTV